MLAKRLIFKINGSSLRRKNLNLGVWGKVPRLLQNLFQGIQGFQGIKGHQIIPKSIDLKELWKIKFDSGSCEILNIQTYRECSGSLS